MRDYFSGGKVIKVARQGYDEPITIPRASQGIVDGAIGWAVKEGKLWLTHGATSLYAEDIPAGLLTDDARLQPRPTPVSAKDVLPESLPGAWGGDVTTAQAIAEALSAKVGKPLPWAIVRAAIDGAFQGRLLERTVDSGPYACDYAGAQQVKLRVPNTKPMIKPKDEVPKPPAGVLTATAYLKPGEVQDFADQIGDIGNVAVGYNLKIQVRIEVGSEGNRPPEDVVAKINEKLGEVPKEFGLRGGSNILV